MMAYATNKSNNEFEFVLSEAALKNRPEVS